MTIVPASNAGTIALASRRRRVATGDSLLFAAEKRGGDKACTSGKK
jgi:hypothetical protein